MAGRLRLNLGLLVVTSISVVIGCAPKNQLVVPPPPEVTVAKPVQREVADALVFSGWTAATAAVDLRSRVNGYLEKVNFEDGAMVKEGDLLFVIEQQPFKTALAAAEAEFQGAAPVVRHEIAAQVAAPFLEHGEKSQVEADGCLAHRWHLPGITLGWKPGEPLGRGKTLKVRMASGQGFW